MAIAIPKTDQQYQTEVWAKLMQAAKTGFPTMFDANGQCLRPDFAWKITDGDSTVPNQNNKRPCDKPGYPGHWVLNFSGGFAPSVYSKNGEAVLTSPDQLKRGYYVRVYGSVTANGDTQKPGVYLNPSMVELVGYGEEIVSGPDGAAVFGGAPAAQLPAGASATPLAPTTQIAQPGGMPGVPGAAPAAPAAPGMPGMAPAAPAAPGMAPVAPAPDFLNPPATPTPPVKTYNVQGTEYTAEQLRGYNWTDEQIAALG
jgi:hypothetical protein